MFRGELGFLSNMHPEPFFVPALGLVVPSLEHAYQALKTLFPQERARVLLAPTPEKSKVRGQAVTLRSDWEEVKLPLMEELLAEKFSRGHLRWDLAATEKLELVETNYWHDQFWGDCFCRRHDETPGLNHLGQLLMELRKTI